MREARDLDFPLPEYRRRLERIQALLDDGPLDGLFLTMRDQVEYLSGFRVVSLRLLGKSFWLVVPRGAEPVLIVDSIHEVNAERTSCLEDVRIWGPGGRTAVDHLVEVFRENGLEHAAVGMELGSGLRVNMCQNDYEEIRSRLPRVRFADCGELLGRWKMVKSPGELERIREACKITSSSLEKVFPSIGPGMTEGEILARIVSDMLARGAETIYNSTNLAHIALQVDRTDQVNPSPILRRGGTGDWVRFDGGAVYRGYCSDISRNTVIGGPPSAPLARAYEACVQVLDAAAGAVRAGVTSAEVCAAAEEEVRRLGYESRRRRTMDRISVAKGHMIGHGMGLSHHELPFICPADETVWEEGMVVALEIGLGEQEYGFSDLEDNYLVTADGCERLSPCPRNLWQEKEAEPGPASW